MPAVRSILRNMLAAGGISDVLEAEDGERAWELLEESPAEFAAVIADWNMPRMTGAELLRRLQGRGDGTLPHFVLITADGNLPLLRRLQTQRGVTVLLKPFSGQQLLEALRNAGALPEGAAVP